MKIISFPVRPKPVSVEPVPAVASVAPFVAAPTPPVVIDLAPLKESLQAVESEIQQWKNGAHGLNENAWSEVKQSLQQVTDRLSALEQRPMAAPGLSADDLNQRLETFRQEFLSKLETHATPVTPLPIASVLDETTAAPQEPVRLILPSLLPADVSTPSLWKRLWLYLREPAFKSKEN